MQQGTVDAEDRFAPFYSKQEMQSEALHATGLVGRLRAQSADGAGHADAGLLFPSATVKKQIKHQSRLRARGE